MAFFNLILHSTNQWSEILYFAFSEEIIKLSNVGVIKTSRVCPFHVLEHQPFVLDQNCPRCYPNIASHNCHPCHSVC